MFKFKTYWISSVLVGRLRTPVHQAFAYGIRHVSIVIQWTVTQSSVNHNENMPYPVRKCLPYGVRNLSIMLSTYNIRPILGVSYYVKQISPYGERCTSSYKNDYFFAISFQELRQCAQLEVKTKGNGTFEHILQSILVGVKIRALQLTSTAILHMRPTLGAYL